LKIKLDECIANRVALAVMAITGNREGYEVSYIRHGDGSPDPDWIRKFADEGGTAIVSGDHNILQHWPNLVAYTESGLISFFPPSEYEHLKGYGRAAFIIRWWPAIIEKIKLSKFGDRWRLPMVWHATDHSKMKPIKDPRVDAADAPEASTADMTQVDLEFDERPQGGKP
jgi:hypothetical protein